MDDVRQTPAQTPQCYSLQRSTVLDGKPTTFCCSSFLILAVLTAAMNYCRLDIENGELGSSIPEATPAPNVHKRDCKTKTFTILYPMGVENNKELHRSKVSSFCFILSLSFSLSEYVCVCVCVCISVQFDL